MKILQRLVLTVLIASLAFAGLAYFSGNQFLLKGLWAAYLHGNTSATIDDAKFFDTRTVQAGAHIPWEVAESDLTLSDTLRTTLENTQAVAFLVAQNGKIQYEEYWDGYGPDAKSNSFSMAKSITAMLGQCAIQDGYIKNWDVKAKEFLPDLQGPHADEVTLRHLVTMTAGLDFNEHYSNPFDITAKLYYGPNSEELMLSQVPVTEKPGSYEYQSGATQLLGLCVSEAIDQPLAEYASEKLWKPLGAKNDATWHVDSEDGNELAFCCFNSNARDFARFGQMMLQHGNFNGQQILDSTFVDTATVPFAVPRYGHSFWMTDKFGTHVYYLRGLLGQYVIVIPEHGLVVVRLGHEASGNDQDHSYDFLLIVEEILKTVG